jgi:uncharacterized integral membrane protein
VYNTAYIVIIARLGLSSQLPIMAKLNTAIMTLLRIIAGVSTQICIFLHNFRKFFQVSAKILSLDEMEVS